MNEAQDKGMYGVELKPEKTFREAARDKMNEILKTRSVPTDVSWEYASSYVVQHAESPEMRRDLAEVWIDEMVDEGRYANAVEALASEHIAETDLPQMQNADYVGGLLEKAQAEGDDFQAWRITWTLAPLEKNGELKDRIFKNEKPYSKFSEGWVARERRYFEKEIQESLTLAKENEETLNWNVWDRVHMAHTSWNFREDGYYSDNPHPLAIDTARAFCRQLALRGMDDHAYETAIQSKLPATDLKVYEQKVLDKRDQLKARLKRHFQNLTQRV